MIISRQSILQLYKGLFKYGHQLKYTDKDFYFKYIRNQFDSIKESQDNKKLERLYKVCIHIFFCL
jgi:hypothetical protein